MVHINLLPVRDIIRRNKAKNELGVFLVAFLAVLGALAFLWFLQSGKVTQLQTKLANLNQEKTQYNKILAQIKQLEGQKKTLETQIQVIEQLRASSSMTVHVLDEIATLTPPKRMWLTSLSQKGAGVQLKGTALDNRTIAKYMDDLKTSLYIQSVTLSSSSLQTVAERSLKSFGLSCSILMPTETTNSEKQ